jgi:V8-like Glu-specific endopeptidase
MRRPRLQDILCGSILLGAFCSSFASAAIFESDDRHYVSSDLGSPFSPVGLVKRGVLIEHFTIGTLVDECHVLTSQHMFNSQASPIGKRLAFTGALGSKHQLSSGGTVIAAGGLEKYRSNDQQFVARAHDWLLLRLDKCLGMTLGFAKLRAWPSGADELAHLQSVGYPMDRRRSLGLTLDPSCGIRGVYTLVWLNDCASLPGNSGGPIFRLSQSNGRPRLEIYAIQNAGWYEPKAIAFRTGIENQATPVSAILPNIQKYLAQRSRPLGAAQTVASLDTETR